MKLFKIIKNLLKQNNKQKPTLNSKQNNIKYVRNKYGFISEEIKDNKDISQDNKK